MIMVFQQWNGKQYPSPPGHDLFQSECIANDDFRHQRNQLLRVSSGYTSNACTTIIDLTLYV